METACLPQRLGRRAAQRLLSAKPASGHPRPVALSGPASRSTGATAVQMGKRRNMSERKEKGAERLTSRLKAGRDVTFVPTPFWAELGLCLCQAPLGTQVAGRPYRFLLDNSLKVSPHDDRSQESFEWRAKVTASQARHQAWRRRGQQQDVQGTVSEDGGDGGCPGALR